MDFLASYWWAFLSGTVVFAIAAVFLLMNNARRTIDIASQVLRKHGKSDDPLFEELLTSRTWGFLTTCVVLAILSGVLALMGVLVAIIDYFKT